MSVPLALVSKCPLIFGQMQSAQGNNEQAHLSNIQAIIHRVFEWTHFNFTDKLFLQETKQMEC